MRIGLLALGLGALQLQIATVNGDINWIAVVGGVAWMIGGVLDFLPDRHK